MINSELPIPPMKEPLAELERELIAAFVAGAREGTTTRVNRHDDQTHQLLVDASIYATARLSEVESRLHYLRSLRGEA